MGIRPSVPFDVSRYFRWRMYEDYAGGPVTDLYPHSFTPVASILNLGLPEKVVSSGGMFRYTEREVPDTFSVLVDYPQKITIAILEHKAMIIPEPGGRGSGGRIPIIRGWDGTITVQGDEVIFVPTPPEENKPKKEAKRFKIEHGKISPDFGKISSPAAAQGN